MPSFHEHYDAETFDPSEGCPVCGRVLGTSGKQYACDNCDFWAPLDAPPEDLLARYETDPQFRRVCELVGERFSTLPDKGPTIAVAAVAAAVIAEIAPKAGEPVTPAHAIAVLNRVHHNDPTVLSSLIELRVPCNDAVQNDPTVQVGRGPNDDEDGPYKVGLVGIINGIFGTMPNGWGWIAYHLRDDGSVLGFGLTNELAPDDGTGA